MVGEVRDVGVVGVNVMVGVVLWDLKRLYFANKFSYQPQRISDDSENVVIFEV